MFSLTDVSNDLLTTFIALYYIQVAYQSSLSHTRTLKCPTYVMYVDEEDGGPQAGWKVEVATVG